MCKSIRIKDYLFLSSMLFGLFFGAGNLIFPVFLGQQAAAGMWPAIVGFCLTGVGLPLLGITAMGISKSEGMTEMADHVGKKYSTVFTCALYLSIGPLFAIPRTATVSFAVGIQPMLASDAAYTWIIRCLFSALFFAVVLYFSLKPSGILTWVGKILNPLFLIFLAILAVAALLHPMGAINAANATELYQSHSLFQGFLDGYNTMDALASLAFGIVLIQAIRGLGVTEPGAVSAITVKAGILSSALMALIYGVLAVMGAQSRSVVGVSADGGEALYLIGTHYFGRPGAILLGIMITVACLKTAIGLIVSCATTFSEMFPNRFSYRIYAVVFCVFSFGVANFGLNRLISLSLPVLMILYPLTITLIGLCLIGRWFAYDRIVFLAVTIPTLAAALIDSLHYLPESLSEAVAPVLKLAGIYLPFFNIGMGWFVPAMAGFVVGLAFHFLKKGQYK